MLQFKKYAKSIFWWLLSWFLIHVFIVVLDGTNDYKGKADIAVILGNKVNENGTLSKRLEKRLERGLQLYQEGKIKGILVSGGLGNEGYYEGEKMREFLLKNNVPDSVIFVDNEGNTTELTVMNVLKMKENLHFKSVIAVSQYFHISRTKMLFRKHGLSKIYGASPNYFEWRDLYALFREFFAFYFSLF